MNLFRKLSEWVHSPDRFYLQPEAKAFVDAITSTLFQMFLLVLCTLLALSFFHLATQKFSPEVQKITITNETQRKFGGTIDIQAVLNSSVIKKEYGVNQFINIELPNSSTTDSLLAGQSKPEKNNNYKYHSAIRAAFSGRDMFNPDFKDTLWHPDADGANGERRCREVEESTFLVEQRSQDGFMRESVMFYGNDIFHKSKSRNPYIAFYLKLNGFDLEEDAAAGISFYYTISDDADSRDFEKDNMEYQHPINLISSYPKPTTVSPIGLSFEGEEFQTILKDGLYIIAEDLSAKKLRDVESFWYSLLLGAFISWIIQLIVSIIRNWKKAFAHLGGKKQGNE